MHLILSDLYIKPYQLSGGLIMSKYSKISGEYSSDKLAEALQEMAKGMGQTVPAPLPYPPPVPRELRGTVKPVVEVRAPKHGTSGKTDPGGLTEHRLALPEVLEPASSRMADELEHLISEHYSSRKVIVAPIISELPSELDPEITIVEEILLCEDFGNVMPEPISNPYPVKLDLDPLAALTEKELRVAVLARLPKAVDRVVFDNLSKDLDSKAFRILCATYLRK